MKCPRCPCGAYALAYAKQLGHVCAAGDPRPAKRPHGRPPGLPRALRCSCGAYAVRYAKSIGHDCAGGDPQPASRCPCGAYRLPYAARINHTCSAGDQWPVKNTAAARRVPAALVEAILIRRAEGARLQQIGEEFGRTRERIRQIIRDAGVPICRECKLPGELVKGRRLCARCYQDMMNNRPSKQKTRSGYRKSRWGHKRATAVRLARAGKTRHQIAAALGVTHQTVCDWFSAMRRDGRDVEPAPDPYFTNRQKEK